MSESTSEIAPDAPIPGDAWVVDAYVRTADDVPISGRVTVEFWRPDDPDSKVPYGLTPDQAVETGRRLAQLGSDLGGKVDKS